MSNVGVISIGVRTPIIRKGDDLVSIVKDSVFDAAKEINLSLRDGDIVAVTEAVVARSQNNYATVEQIAKDIRQKTGGGVVGVLNPILSRNRFSMILKAVSLACEKVVIQLSYPCDEVGNPLLDWQSAQDKCGGVYDEEFTAKEFKDRFGSTLHPFTDVDYIDYYSKICPNSVIIISNKRESILKHTNCVIVSEIHSRQAAKEKLRKLGAKVFGLDDILNESVDGSGFNSLYGLLGSNLATEGSIKLFPQNSQEFVQKLSKEFFEATGKKIEVMVYGDGAFKDPVGGIWELADPTPCPAFTKGLLGSPHELKLKYLADTALKDMDEAQAEAKLKELIRAKSCLKDEMLGQGTTPRRYTDLLASLADLTSGSGDRGTPVILIKNYFSNYADK